MFRFTNAWNLLEAVLMIEFCHTVANMIFSASSTGTVYTRHYSASNLLLNSYVPDNADVPGCFTAE